MRWPLRRQILLPMVFILLLAVGFVSVLNAWVASVQVRRRLEQQLADVVQTLSATNFPLEHNVLRQLRGLTGADYVLVSSTGRATAASDESLRPSAENSRQPAEKLDLSSATAIEGRRLFHLGAPLDRRPLGGERSMLHVFYSESAWQEARWQAIWPPLAIGLVSVALVAIIVSFVAQRVTWPIRSLRTQVERIAQGEFRELPIPSRDDEVKDLAVAVNQMTAHLSQLEVQIRKNERLKALGTLGGGIAHQIRNAATGCRIALDLHRRDCQKGAQNGNGSESLDVAVQQLIQIETYIQRFLALGKPAAPKHAQTDLAVVMGEALDLVRPMARHMGIGLDSSAPAESATLLADSHSLTQMVVNLVVNAIEAAAQTRLAAGEAVECQEAVVHVQLKRGAEGRYELAVGDPGPGPSANIRPRLFEPFATDKPGGTGLGLAVARQIAQDHGGSIGWERRCEKTWFCVSLPAAGQGAT